MTQALIVMAVLLSPLFAGILYGIGLGIRKRAKERARLEAGHKRCLVCEEWYPPYADWFHRHPLPKDESKYEAPPSGPFR